MRIRYIMEKQTGRGPRTVSVVGDEKMQEYVNVGYNVVNSKVFK